MSDRNEEVPIPGFFLSLAASLLLASGAVKMFQFPTITSNPSFINCFSFIDPETSNAMFWAALVLAAATAFSSLKKLRITIALIEAMVIWTVAYFVLVAGTSAPHALNAPGVLKNLILLCIFFVAILAVVRWFVIKSCEEIK